MTVNSTPAKINYFCRQYINPKIYDRINSVIDENGLPIEYPQELLDVLIHEKNDSSIVTWLKLALYYFEFNGLGNIIEPGVEIAKIYGIPLDSLQESVKFIPQIKIFFRENLYDASSDKRRPRISEMTIRVNEPIKTTIINNDITSLIPIAENIATLFQNITYKKGYQKYHYRDLDNNYRLSVFVDTEEEAKTLFTALLAINSDTPDFSNYLVYPQTSKDYTIVKTRKILNTMVKMPQERTEANMIFYKAELHWKGIDPIILVNNSNKHKNAIIELKYL